MRAREFLTELGNSFYPYQKMPDIGHGAYSVDYISKEADNLCVTFSLDGDKDLEIEFSTVGGGYAVSNTAWTEAIRILGTVKRIIEVGLDDLVNRWNPRKVFFSASRTEASRVKLYDRAVPIISNILGPEWDFDTAGRPMSSKVYIWTRGQKQ